MLRIAECSDSFLPISDGVGRVAHAYARELALRGHDVYVVTPMVNDGFRGRHPFEIVDFVAMPKTVFARDRLGFAPLDVHYLSRVESLRFDVVHAHSPGAAGMEAVRLADKLRVPLVGTLHTKYIREYLAADEDEKKASLGKYFALDFFNRCDEIWTVSDEARALLMDHGFAGNIEVFDNGSDGAIANEETVRRARETFHIGPEPVLLFAGSLDRKKNLPRLLEAAAVLKRRGVSFRLLFAGEGEEEKSVREMARTLNLSGTARFLGRVGDETLLDGLYAASALCLFPEQSVTAGLVVREAAAQGTPSLVIAGSASAALVENDVSGIVCADTPESMANAIEAYLSKPERMRQMRLATAEIVPASWAKVVSGVEARYEELAHMDKSALKRKRGIFRKELEKVDMSLEKRALDLTWTFLKQDTQNLYAYPYYRQKTPPEAGRRSTKLPRSTPEAEGISSSAINALIDSINADEGACAQAIMILKNGKVICEAQWSPYDARYAHELYSLSKSVTSTAVGMLWQEGLIALDEKLNDIFFDKAPDDLEHPSWQFTVGMLLNMSTGSQYNEVCTALGADWEKEFLQAGVKFKPGSAFCYNSLNTYMLAAIVRRKTGLTLTEYLAPRLFEPLGISEYDWEVCPNGTEKGGWGLTLATESVAKIGQLYLNKGVWEVEGEKKRLLSEEWISEATRSQIETPNGEITYGYGHQIWMTKHKGAFLFNGAFGQYMLALPDHNALIALFSGTARLFAEGGVLDYVDEAFARDEGKSLLPSPEGAAALAGTINALTARYRKPYFDPTRTSVSFAALASRLDGRVYSFDANIAGLFPVILQNVHNNYTAGIRQIAFSAEAGGFLAVEIVEGACQHRFLLCEDAFTAATIQQREDSYEVRFSVQTEAAPTGEWMLHVNAHFIETPYTRVMHFTFDDDGTTLLLDESPTVQDASTMLLELSGVTRMEVVRHLMPLLRREKMQSTLKTFTTMTIRGRL